MPNLTPDLTQLDDDALHDYFCKHARYRPDEPERVAYAIRAGRQHARTVRQVPPQGEGA